MSNVNLVSVIVPIYNGEKYLTECIESIVSQSFRFLEIILIDDGSTDKSGEICDKYAKYDNRIVVIHKENEGQAVARNLGKQLAKGEYIVYVDCDDVIRQDMIELMASTQKRTNTDIVVVLYQEFIDHIAGYKKNSDIDYRYVEQVEIEQLLVREKGYLLHTVTGKLFKKSIIEDIYFPLLRAIEDEFFLTDVLISISNMVIINEEMYFYRQTAKSTMRGGFNVNRSLIVDALVDRKEKYRMISRKNLIPEIQGQIILESAYWYRQLNVKSKFAKRKKKMRRIFKKNFNGGMRSKQLSMKLKLLLLSNKISPKLYDAILKLKFHQ